ncbi:hypothetical protein BBBGCB_BBBGCB_12450, partial [Dysosmobacter welbionis]
PGSHLPGQRLAGPRLSLHAQSDQGGAGWELGPDGSSLLQKGRLDLGGGGVLRQPLLRQFHQLQLTEAGQPLDVLR